MAQRLEEWRLMLWYQLHEYHQKPSFRLQVYAPCEELELSWGVCRIDEMPLWLLVPTALQVFNGDVNIDDVKTCLSLCARRRVRDKAYTVCVTSMEQRSNGTKRVKELYEV